MIPTDLRSERDPCPRCGVRPEFGCQHRPKRELPPLPEIPDKPADPRIGQPFTGAIERGRPAAQVQNLAAKKARVIHKRKWR